jgi:hypothetical protein
MLSARVLSKLKVPPIDCWSWSSLTITDNLLLRSRLPSW